MILLLQCLKHVKRAHFTKSVNALKSKYSWECFVTLHTLWCINIKHNKRLIHIFFLFGIFFTLKFFLFPFRFYFTNSKEALITHSHYIVVNEMELSNINNFISFTSALKKFKSIVH